jgi:hypothetical protein
MRRRHSPRFFPVSSTSPDLTKRKFKHGKELSRRGLEYECTQEEHSTSITTQLVFHIISALLFAHRKLAEEGKFSLGSYLAICWCDPPSHFAVREETYVRGSRLEC